ncbi:hypothetical protein [Enterovibrio calviensis]|uniref:hypothetical protein n=1 Tax=Enterovibrio calviensis TaxID=91359 RepID=UPI003735BD35
MGYLILLVLMTFFCCWLLKLRSSVDDFIISDPLVKLDSRLRVIRRCFSDAYLRKASEQRVESIRTQTEGSALLLLMVLISFAWLLTGRGVDFPDNISIEGALIVSSLLVGFGTFIRFGYFFSRLGKSLLLLNRMAIKFYFKKTAKWFVISAPLLATPLAYAYFFLYIQK